MIGAETPEAEQSMSIMNSRLIQNYRRRRVVSDLQSEFLAIEINLNAIRDPRRLVLDLLET
jgi:hypothetical protein